MSSGTARQKIYWFMNSWKVNESSCFLLYHRFSNTLTILQCLEVHTIKLKKNTNCPIRLFPKSSSFLPEYYMAETVASTDSTLVWIVTTFNPQKTGLLESPGLCRTGSIIHRTYITTKYSEFKTSDIRHLLSFLRWTNLLTSFVVCTFTILPIYWILISVHSYYQLTAVSFLGFSFFLSCIQKESTTDLKLNMVSCSLILVDQFSSCCRARWW